MWTPNYLDPNKPLYLALCDAISAAIREGELLEGEKLPTHRKFANQLGVTAGTVSRAYQEAERLGLVQSRIGSGTYVFKSVNNSIGLSQLQGPTTANSLVDLCANVALPPEYQGLQQALGKITKCLPQLNLLGYQSDQGVARQLQWAQTWLQGKYLSVEIPRLTITMGGQHGIMLSLMVLAKAGDAIACEGLTYPGLAAIAMQLGMKVKGLEMDHEGVIPESFESACKQNKIRVLYLTPQVQNPTNACMGLQRRLELIALAKLYQVMIIEDTVSEIHIDDLCNSFAVLAPNQCFSILSHSKHLDGGLRVGYLVAPVDYKDRLGQAIRAQCLSSSALVVEATQQWIETENYLQMLQKNRQELASRREWVNEILGQYGALTQESSSYVWLPLDEPWRAQDLQASLLAQGVKVLTADVFAIGRFPVPQAIRFCLGGVRTRASFDQAVGKIAQQLSQHPSARLSVF